MFNKSLNSDELMVKKQNLENKDIFIINAKAISEE